MQNTTKFIIAGLITTVLFGGIFILSNKSNSNMSDSMNMSDGANTMSNTEMVPENTIPIQDFEFTKEKITIERGTTITWINRDEAKHDITPTGGPSDFMGSELLSQGETYEFTFDTPGTYTYNCSPHPYMTAEIEVL